MHGPALLMEAGSSRSMVGWKVTSILYTGASHHTGEGDLGWPSHELDLKRCGVEEIMRWLFVTRFIQHMVLIQG